VGVPVVLAGSMELTWDPVSHPDLAGYRIYYGSSSGNYTQSIDVGLATSSALTGVADCSTHFVAVRSLVDSGSESADASNEISGWPRPTISNASPQQLAPGQTVTLVVTGNNFKPDSTLEFDDNSINVLSQQVDSCAQMTAQISVGLGTNPGSLSFDVVHGDRVYGSASNQLTVSTDSTPMIPNTNWSLTHVSSEQLGGTPTPGSHAIDGDPGTYWHTRFLNGNDSHPHEIRIDLGTLYDVEGVRFLGRQDGSQNGRIADYELYLSASDGNWGAPRSSGTLVNQSDLQRVSAVGTAVRFVRLVTTSEVNGQPWTSLAELSVEGSASATPNQAPNGSIVAPSSNVTRQAGQLVVFSGDGTDPEDGTPAQWSWDFGDPAIPDSTAQNPGSVAFPNVGVFTVTLTVTDADGLADPSPATVTVTIVPTLEAAANLRRTDVKIEE